MAKVSVIPNPRRTNKDGSRILVIRLGLHGKSKYFATDIKVYPDQWNDRLKQYKGKYSHLNEGVLNLLSKAQTVLNRLEESDTLSFNRFEQELSGDKKHTDVFTYLDQHIDSLKSMDKVRNAMVYQELKNLLTRFGTKHLMFQDIDVKYLTSLEAFMRKNNLKGNTMFRYLRTFRALYNKAVGDGYINHKLYPFKNSINPRGYNVGALAEKTQKRALTEGDMKKIKAYQPRDWKEELAKDVFLFSFYTQGMSFADMCMLKWEHVKDDRIYYARLKTRSNARLTIKITPTVQDIMDRSKDPKSPYILPILNELHGTAQQKVDRMRKKLTQVNQGLKSIARNAGIEGEVSTYWARHTYATLLKLKGVSIGVISQAMGHTSEATTQIYLDSFANEEVDKANELLP